jgi:hypothetical protein
MFADVHFEIPSSEFQNQAIKDRHLPAGTKQSPTLSEPDRCRLVLSRGRTPPRLRGRLNLRDSKLVRLQYPVNRKSEKIVLLLSLATPLRMRMATPTSDDVSSLDSIIAAAYDVISGPAGQKRDWDRERSIFPSRSAADPDQSRDGCSRFGAGTHPASARH